MNRNFIKLSTLAVCIAAFGLIYCGTEETTETKPDAGTVVIPPITDAGNTTVTDGGGTCVKTAEKENTNAMCGDGIDNDCDGHIDCAGDDYDCTKNAAVTVCGGGTDAGTGDCTPTGEENTEEACSDGKDNDCSGHIDCSDYSCCKYGVVTEGVTSCQVGSCEGPGKEQVEYGDVECSNGTDEDGDTYIDCNDNSCCYNGKPMGNVTVCGDDGTGKCVAVTP